MLVVVGVRNRLSLPLPLPCFPSLDLLLLRLLLLPPLCLLPCLSRYFILHCIAHAHRERERHKYACVSVCACAFWAPSQPRVSQMASTKQTRRHAAIHTHTHMHMYVVGKNRPAHCMQCGRRVRRRRDRAPKALCALHCQTTKACDCIAARSPKEREREREQRVSAALEGAFEQTDKCGQRESASM